MEAFKRENDISSTFGIVLFYFLCCNSGNEYLEKQRQ